MRRTLYLLLTSLALVSFSTLAKLKKPEVTAPMEPLDEFVLELDMARTLDELGLGTFEGGFGTYFLESATTFMKSNPEVTFSTLDQRLRKWKTRIHLFAIHKKYLGESTNGQSLCLSLFPGQKNPPLYGLFVMVGGAEEKKQIKKQYGIGSDKENSKNLNSVGTLEPCQEV